ncbi:hypothetical protein GF407_16575 [candidate division KSB1 bacterium]|nr:hypothetical protein [candidate division KSB1 bacterium]
MNVEIDKIAVETRRAWFFEYGRTFENEGNAVRQNIALEKEHTKRVCGEIKQVGWIYDINFKPAFHSIFSRHYLESIRDVLPESEKLNNIFSTIYFYIDETLEKN